MTFEDVRQKYKFIVIGYVVMPEHIHLLIGEPDVERLSVAIGVLKQRVSKRCREGRDLRHPAFWTTRYYDFNVYSQKKKQEKLGYIHLNPVRRGLVKSPEEWKWSSARYYYSGEPGIVKIG
jgi:putative transposase